MSLRTIAMTEQLYDYLLTTSVREPEILKELRQETAKLSQAQMQISPEQGQFMALLIKLISARKTIEVGVFTGYSSLITALALPSDGKIIACDVSKEWTDIAKQFWRKAGVANKIDLRLGPAGDTLTKLIAAGESNTFDFAFIDADKKGYTDYYEKCLQLLRPEGLIALDNMLQNGRVADQSDQNEVTQAIRALNEKIFKDERVDISLVPIGDGLTLVGKR